MPKIDEEMKKEETAQEIRERVEAAFNGTALFTNKIYATCTPMGMRLTFMERSPGGAERYCTAVFMQMPDAIALKDLLDRQLANVEFSIEAKPDAEA